MPRWATEELDSVDQPQLWAGVGRVEAKDVADVAVESFVVDVVVAAADVVVVVVDVVAEDDAPAFVAAVAVEEPY